MQAGQQLERQRDRLAILLEEMEAEFPGFRIVPKANSPMQRAIHGALAVVTFGGQRAYLDVSHHGRPPDLRD